MNSAITSLLNNLRDESYRTLDNSANALVNIFEKNQELIPSDLDEKLEKYLEKERRNSVIQNITKLIKVIRKTKQENLSTI